MSNVLYISYDGLTDALGQSQILAYLKRLSGKNNRITILSFEKDHLYRSEGDKIRQIVAESGLQWVPLRYTKKPPVVSTLRDIRRGYRMCQKLHRQQSFQIVHCRGYIAAILGRRLQKAFGLKFIFDMRGWWPDEKLESGFWNRRIYRLVYNYFKKLEREFFLHCDYAVSLTYKGKEEIVQQGMAPEAKIGVIPTCVDFEIFKARDRASSGDLRKEIGIAEHEKVFVYSGSVGGNYDPDTLINVYLAFQNVYPESFLLILSKDPFDTGLKEKFSTAGIRRMAVFNAPFLKVTDYLRVADAGFIYYKISFSTIGRSPTKLGEYWASGLPVIALKGIGDVDTIISHYSGSGILLSEDSAAWEQEIRSLVFLPAEQLRSFAIDYFSIDKGVLFYQNIYQLLSSPAVQPALAACHS